MSRVRSVLSSRRLSTLIVTPSSTCDLGSILRRICRGSVPIVSCSRLVVSASGIGCCIAFGAEGTKGVIKSSVVGGVSLRGTQRRGGALAVRFLVNSPSSHSTLFFCGNIVRGLRRCFSSKALMYASKGLAFSSATIVHSKEGATGGSVTRVLSRGCARNTPSVVYANTSSLTLKTISTLRSTKRISKRSN